MDCERGINERIYKRWNERQREEFNEGREKWNGKRGNGTRKGRYVDEEEEDEWRWTKWRMTSRDNYLKRESTSIRDKYKLTWYSEEINRLLGGPTLTREIRILLETRWESGTRISYRIGFLSLSISFLYLFFSFSSFLHRSLKRRNDERRQRSLLSGLAVAPKTTSLIQFRSKTYPT